MMLRSAALRFFAGGALLLLVFVLLAGSAGAVRTRILKAKATHQGRRLQQKVTVGAAALTSAAYLQGDSGSGGLRVYVFDMMNNTATQVCKCAEEGSQLESDDRSTKLDFIISQIPQPYVPGNSDETKARAVARRIAGYLKAQCVYSMVNPNICGLSYTKAAALEFWNSRSFNTFATAGLRMRDNDNSNVTQAAIDMFLSALKNEQLPDGDASGMPEWTTDGQWMPTPTAAKSQRSATAGAEFMAIAGRFEAYFGFMSSVMNLAKAKAAERNQSKFWIPSELCAGDGCQDSMYYIETGGASQQIAFKCQDSNCTRDSDVHEGFGKADKTDILLELGAQVSEGASVGHGASTGATSRGPMLMKFPRPTSLYAKSWLGTGLNEFELRVVQIAVFNAEMHCNDFTDAGFCDATLPAAAVDVLAEGVRTPGCMWLKAESKCVAKYVNMPCWPGVNVEGRTVVAYGNQEPGAGKPLYNMNKGPPNPNLDGQTKSTSGSKTYNGCTQCSNAQGSIAGAQIRFFSRPRRLRYRLRRRGSVRDGHAEGAR